MGEFSHNTSLRLFHEFKGAGLAALLVLGLQMRPVTQDWLGRTINYTDKPLARALGYLADHGFARRVEAGWILTEDGKRLRLRLVLGETEATPEPAPSDGPEQAGIVLAGPHGRENSFARNFSVPCCSNNPYESRSEEDNEIIQQEDSDPGRKNPPRMNAPRTHSPEIRPSNDPQAVEPGSQKLWEELRLAGIRRNARTEALAQLPHVTAEYVRAHRLHMAESGQEGVKWAGLLITILEKGEPAPKAPRSITCPVCSQYPCICEQEWEP